MGDAADRLQGRWTNAWGRQPMLVRDLVNFSEARTASLELTQERMLHPRWNGFERERLIQVHVLSRKLNHRTYYCDVQIKAVPRR